ncbi:hypothetical protein RCF27_09240 [Rhodococcus pyridinivorans]|uniref:hypothetical protein n=1 Tax=Rhodococcus pyridinivorans TaxID=103816 RepID=UPI00280C35D9|nr:hypothetical protein [Rhodococcus pyridinivorans]WMM74442.1 hypothetical protein RCF27_09240 [Rhodococcus pyridinivorans]
MITRPTFIALIDAIQRQREQDEAIEGHINALMPDSGGGIFITPLREELVDLLEAELGSQSDWISWWLWDAPKAGKNLESSVVHHEDGRRTVIRDAGELYDFIRTATPTPSDSTTSY